MATTAARRDPAPDVSVVVIVYNDAARLPDAVRSVLGQTLRAVEAVIVDDHSTDGSHDVARALAAAHPGRVRALRLPENSGGCGAPRNAGVEAARAPYVMFLDSDDVLERNACRNMLGAAEETGADLVAGLCVRLLLDRRTVARDPWYPWLYSRTRTLQSVRELPDLFAWDTLSTNKCYRRDFLLENNLLFLRGMYYEDLMFSAEAYLAARRITLIPNEVYRWHVHERAAEKSVSNRRHEMANFAHRMEIHGRVDALLGRRRMPDLQRAKDVKFLKHDLVLHLRDLPFRDDAYRREFASLARGYLAGMDPGAYDEVPPLQAVCAYLLLRGDWERLGPAVDSLLNRRKISAPLTERDGRVYWCEEHLGDPLGRRLLDVTDLGLHTKPLDSMFLRNELTAYGSRAGRVRLAGRIVNPLGTIRPGARLSAELEFAARRRGLRSFRFPVRTLRHEGDAIAWEAEAGLSRALRPVGVVDTVWDVRLRLTADGVRTTTRLTAGGAALPDGSVPVRPRLGRLLADRLEPTVTARGHLAFLLTAGGAGEEPGAAPGGAAGERLRELVARGVHGPPGRFAKSGVRRARRVRERLTGGDAKLRLYHEVFCRLPIRPGTAVFESHLGRSYGDSPRAVHEELRRRGLPVRVHWSYAGPRPEGFPEDAVLVRRWSPAYLRALAQAEFWVDNQGFPLKLRKRPGTTYIQTWHGSALKKMGFDEPEHKLWPREKQQEYQEALDRFDRFLIRSEHDVRTLARAYRLPERALLRVGYPRNDALVRARERERATGRRTRGPLAAGLGIPEDRTVLLYAPTFRRTGGRRFDLPFDVERFAKEFDDRFVLLVRAHYLNHVVLPPSVRDSVLDVSALPDTTPVLELADALITDYSSVMFDYALLDRPMIFFTYDYDSYSREGRGTYFELADHAPGPLVRTEDELYAALRTLETDAGRDWEKRAAFAAEFGGYDRGDAARRIVDEFFAPRPAPRPAGRSPRRSALRRVRRSALHWVRRSAPRPAGRPVLRGGR
ncbi:bifunctional glycosyltransferase/CDP-glycerol:glycerophosphate glycerophosphotransferase [Streptomyces lycii]|uniref:Glycosyltransferase n=1 Tax=Streptomyces lycii TaxID=2654337 RepID=A0ABQ7FDQ9_9ACTN|nr:CDP-glycerol glycerophosphotransferase family protein [Streptomyces lycii]KAF4406529.1 glycosyltransferase [Streptomyces lycii]